jgi:hypothetical protein
MFQQANGLGAIAWGNAPWLMEAVNQSPEGAKAIFTIIFQP